MAAHGGTVVTASGGSVTQVDSGSLNVTGTDVELVCWGAEENSTSPALTLSWDPTGANETPTAFTGTPVSAGAYLDLAAGFIDDPTEANASVRLDLASTANCIVGGTFFTDADDMAAGDVASDSDTGTSTSMNATAPNVVTDDMVMAYWIVTGKPAAKSK